MKFFVPQFQIRFGAGKRRVVNVDHDLDQLIPFIKNYRKIYLNFIPLWIKSSYFIYREFGKSSLDLVKDFFNDLKNLYNSAFKIYDKCQSTTSRPGAGWDLALKMMHLADPHLHCVPSLHVMVVCFNQLRIGTLIHLLTENPDNYRREFIYLEAQALQITNSILYMKQHSINCIPAGLIALGSVCPEFNNEYAFKIIDDLRVMNSGTIGRFDEISEYMAKLYSEFYKSTAASDVTEVLLNFLHSYGDRHKVL